MWKLKLIALTPHRLRADAAFAIPALFDLLEAKGWDYAIFQVAEFGLPRPVFNGILFLINGLRGHRHRRSMSDDRIPRTNYLRHGSRSYGPEE